MYTYKDWYEMKMMNKKNGEEGDGKRRIKREGNSETNIKRRNIK